MHKLEIEEEIKRLGLLHCPATYLGHSLRKKIINYVGKNAILSGEMITLAGYLHSLGYDLRDVALAEKLTKSKARTSYFILRAEEVSSFLLQQREMMQMCNKAFSGSFRTCRFFLAFLLELSRKSLVERVDDDLLFLREDEIEGISPLVCLLIKAACAKH